MASKGFYSAVLSISLLAGAAAAGEPKLTVLATDPEAGATLHFGENLFIRYQVDSSSPVVVRVEGWAGGQKLPLANSGLSGLPAGGGEDGAFLFSNTHKAPLKMDELRLVATAGDGSTPLGSLSVPLAVTWGMEPAVVERPRPAWVGEWSSARAKKIHDGIRAYESRPVARGTEAMMPVLGLFLVALVGACAFLPFVAMYSWRGVWRLAALLPTLAIAFVAARIVHDTSVDPTSHNLWPFELLMTGAPGLLFLGVVALVRRFRGAPAN